MQQYEEGQVADTPEEAANLEKADYGKCYNPRCNFYLSPETQASWNGPDDTFDCPHCQMSYQPLSEIPFGGDMYAPGGNTRAGITLKEQGDIGEDVIKELGTLPEYGPIKWWAENYQSPLDGGTKDWGIEVKTINADSLHHRFVPGRVFEKTTKNQQAAEMGYRGILGVLVVLNYRTSLADVYTMEMPLAPWVTQGGKQAQGVVAYRKHNGLHMVKEVAFDNPFMKPESNAPELTQSR